MERLASYTLEITPGPAAADTSPCRVGLRETRGPSLPGRIPSEQDGPSLCRAAGVAAIARCVWGENFFHGREYCTARIGTSIPACMAPVSSGDSSLQGRTRGTAKNSTPKMLPSGRTIEYNGWFSGLYLRPVVAYTVRESRDRASRRLFPAGLGPAQRILK